ncbi:MAG: type II secretion system F family protein [Gemmataceae bacterium]|nr:type II secretion system F family protein [Gemmataceae bacterium]
MTPDDLATLNEQIAGMARAGLPLDQGLASLARDMNRGKLRRVTKGLSSDLESGATLPEALDRWEKELPPYYAGLARAGLRTGRLPEVLHTMTTYSRKIAEVRSTILEAFAYPAVILFVAVVLFSALSLVGIPEFGQIFSEFRMPLPAITVYVLWMGQHPIQSFLLPAVIGVAVLLIGRWILLSFEGGRRFWADIVYNIPLIGTLIRSARLAAFTDLLACMVQYSVPMHEAFPLAGDAAGDPFIAEQARTVGQRLQSGESLGKALAGHGLLPEWVAWMATAGERRGSLAETLHEVAEVYRRHVDVRAGLLRNFLPSLLIVGTAVVLAGVFMMALVVPLVTLIEGLTK